MSKRKKHPRGNPARRGLSFGLPVVAGEFERWMRASSTTLTDPSTARTTFGTLGRIVIAEGLDLLDPDQAEEIVDTLLDLGHDSDGLLDVFHDYLHFQVETSRDRRWEVVHDAIEDAWDDGLPAMLEEALEEESRLDPDRRRAALAAVRIVGRVPELLDWIGRGRPITDSGALRRADIAPFAALLGISARGVAKLPDADDYSDGAAVVDGEAQVQSMWDLPVVAAWWRALVSTEILEALTTRVRPGEAASLWSGDDLPPLQEAGDLVSVFVAQRLAAELERFPDTWGATTFRLVMSRAIAALDPEADAAAGEPQSPMEEMLAPRAERILDQLVELGILERDADGRLRAPQLLRGPFARGLIGATMAAADLFDPEERDPFADPAVQAELASRGIVHTPGMAATVLRDLAPLLAEDGIDLDNLDVDDLETVNAALARATARRNLELFTPVGEQRAQAMTVHRLVTEAIAEGNDALAQVILDGIPSDPTGTLPSVAHVIGTGLGALDEWARHPAWQPAFVRPVLPEGDAAVRTSAGDILRAARDGQAFDRLDALIMDAGGKVVIHATARALAAVVIARAAADGVDVRDLAGRVLATG